MKTVWNNTPGSKQHWLYGGTVGSRILGMVYEVNPTAFTVYRELPASSRDVNRREFLAEMPTLDEAKDLLMTVVGSRS
jgi:fermentation-respiration switch protein FrsA (DUF1100 family)